MRVPQILLTAAALICGSAAAAGLTTDQLIQSLAPTQSDLTGSQRGIRAVAQPSVDLSIQFATGSATLTPAALTQLDALGKALTSSQLSADKFRIEGHTDTVGTADANKALSERRANAVASYLESKFGIASNRLQPIGMGEDGLLVQTPDQTPEAKNRRVHIVNLSA